MSPIWHKLNCLWQFYEGLFDICQKLLLTSVNFVYNWAIFRGRNGHIMKTVEAIWSHWLEESKKVCQTNHLFGHFV